jgi:hypothetical protein
VVDFYIDDMRLARRTVPVISSCRVTAGTFPRGEALGVQLKVAGPAGGVGHASAHAKNVDYFRRVKALDLDNEAGSRADMLALWRYAVRLAEEWNSPGIMIDLEVYNNYRAYNTAWVAEARGETTDALIPQCEEVGQDLAKIIEEEYPQCVAWSLFSRLEKSVRIPGREAPILTTPSYVTLGLLQYAKANNVPLRYICGGEPAPGGCGKTQRLTRPLPGGLIELLRRWVDEDLPRRRRLMRDYLISTRRRLAEYEDSEARECTLERL